MYIDKDKEVSNICPEIGITYESSNMQILNRKTEVFLPGSLRRFLKVSIVNNDIMPSIACVFTQ